MKEFPWHYPRVELASRTLRALVEGPAKALTLFAPRRTGKTEFLLRDLTPCAEQNGHKVVYMSFWRAPLSPLALLLYSLETALKPTTVAGRIGNAASMLKPKLKLSAPFGGGSAEAEIDLSGLKENAPVDLILHLDNLLARLENGKKPTLLLFDEIQELAKDSSNRDLIASLRTSLDTRNAGLRTIFTGSSRAGLQAMFSAAEAPFFHFGTTLDFEPLDERFVYHQVKVFKQATHRKISRAAALNAFAELHNSPYFFRALIELLTLRPDLSIETGLTALREQLDEKSGYAELWLKLTDMQRATLSQLSQGAKKPFSRTTRAAIGQSLNGQPPAIDKVQTALRRLSGLGVVDKWSGQWVIDDPEFSRWVRAR